jgi:UDP-N-acetylglucosamine 1-carboxyvinyltransferase
MRKGALIMARIVIEGGKPLNGELTISGAKNSSLPVLAATLLGGRQSVIHNCPNLSDVDISIKILRHLGCEVERQGDTVIVDPSGLCRWDIPDALMREMRSSIVFLGAIAAKMGNACISFPGGCELGPRPIDLHLKALRRLGLEIIEHHGFLDCSVKTRLKGAEIVLSFPSVGATENILLASTLAEGTTIIVNAAREPEIVDLANCLNSMGAKIYGTGGSSIRIDGVTKLNGAEHRVIPDRIVSSTYMAIAAITGGEIVLRDACMDHLSPVIEAFEEMGCEIKEEKGLCVVKRKGILKPIKNVRTMPYPGFPTDSQALVMAVSTLSKGTSVFIESIFESRFKHASELMRLGAKIKVEGRIAVVEGVEALSGATVEATDLRGGAALIIAGLAIEGKTEITNIRHIDRGYENIELKLKEIGASITRE